MMRKLIWFFLPVLALGLCLAMQQVAWADDTTTGDDQTVTDDGTDTDTDTDDTTDTDTEDGTATDITAAVDTVNSAIDALATSDGFKARLKEMAQGRLGEAALRGFTAEQVQALADQMVQLLGAVNLDQDLPHLNAACQFMIKAMKAGMTAQDAYAMLAAKLAAGEDLKTALKEARNELKGKTAKDNGKNDKNDDGGDDGGGDNGGGQGHGNGHGHNK